MRSDIQAEFSTAVGRSKVTLRSFLDAEAHWQTILRSLFQHNTSGVPRVCQPQDYCVIALYANREGNGVVLGSLQAPNRLAVLNNSDIHFDPCLPL